MLIKSDKDIIKNYFEDSSNLQGGWAEKVVIPENTAQLAAFMKDASSGKTPVTISGGGTGTTGSRVPFGGAVLSMEKFNKIFEISNEKMSAVVQAGVLVEDLKNAAWGKGLFYTSHPTEKTASVGGTVATNASGSRSFMYGSTRKHIRRLSMVLPRGELFEIKRGEYCLTKEKPIIKLSGGREIKIPMPSYRMPDVKNSAGYFAKDGMDLIDLFIGQEGTLSVVTEIEIALAVRPDSILSVFVFFTKEEDAWAFSRQVKFLRAGVLSIEYFDRNAVEILRLKNKNVPGGASAAIFFEQDTGSKDAGAVMDGWAQMISRYNVPLESTWAAMNEKESENFTQLRHWVPEHINDVIRQKGFRKYSTDIAVPQDKFLEMINFYVSTFKKIKIDYVIFGHIGEDHLHVNILPKSESEAKTAEEISLLFVRKGVALGGTVSAEHGIGKLRHQYLMEMYGERGVGDMVKIKKAVDPDGILGLDNIFPKKILFQFG